MIKGKELNKNIGSKSLHHFVQRFAAICQTASHKATGPDEVPAELFKAGGETILDRMHRIWETGEWPDKRTFSTFILLTGVRKLSAASQLFSWLLNFLSNNAFLRHVS